MKTICLAVVIFIASVMARAQGTVSFSNNGFTAVTNGLTGDRVVAGNTFLVSLYYAPDGVTTESLFTQLGSTIGFAAPGIFNGGVLTTPASTPPIGAAMFQVKVWESAYGATYDEALIAPPQNGRFALVGKSDLLRVITGDERGFPVDGDLPGSGLTRIVLYPVPEPSIFLLSFLGLTLLWLKRWRKWFCARHSTMNPCRIRTFLIGAIITVVGTIAAFSADLVQLPPRSVATKQAAIGRA